MGAGKTFAESKVASFKCDQKYTLGDVNEDGDIDIKDVAELLNHVVKNKTLTGNAFLAADVEKDGEIDIRDAAKILNYIVKNISSLE